MKTTVRGLMREEKRKIKKKKINLADVTVVEDVKPYNIGIQALPKYVF